MAGGKETPRQKMIGMMYLVLTALLALNVSKEVVAAFVTINDKLVSSSSIINTKSIDTYIGFEQKKAALLATNQKLFEFNIWQDKASKLKHETNQLVSYILSETNEMIKLTEGEDWVDEKNDSGQITRLKPLSQIKNMDNFDIPTYYFIGSNPNQPIEKGLALRNTIHQFRNSICEMMGTYTLDTKNYEFKSPNNNNIDNALITANPDDTVKLRHFFRMLTIPKKIASQNNDNKNIPWVSAMFDHAPIVAAASILNSLKLDIKNAESLASDFLLSKVNAPKFKFNKIEPLPFANSSYINAGDDINLNVMIAAFDSSQHYKLKYGLDADTVIENWQERSGKIELDNTTPGNHLVKGVIGVMERGITTWKPWRFKYSVGKPLGVISSPELRVVYRGYDNKLMASASGYPQNKISLSGTNCRLSKNGNQWIIHPDNGVRSIEVSVIGEKNNGSKVNLGTYIYKVKNIPRANIYFGSIKSGSTVSIANARAQRIVTVSLDRNSILNGVKFNIIEGTVKVEGIISRPGKIDRNGNLDATALQHIRQSRGKMVTMHIKYSDKSGKINSTNGYQFTVRQ